MDQDIAKKLKIRLIRKLTDKSYNLQNLAINALKQYLKSERIKEAGNNEYRERIEYIKKKIILQIKDKSLRLQAMAFRQAKAHTLSDLEKERNIANKKRGIMRRIMDSSVRLMSMGLNQLVKAAGVNKNTLKNKLKVIIQSLTDKDISYKIHAYNGLKQNWNEIVAKKRGKSRQMQENMIRSLANKGYHLQIMCINALKGYLKSERYDEHMQIEHSFVMQFKHDLDEMTTDKEK